MLKHLTVLAVLAFSLTARAAFAQPQLALSSTTAAPGQSITATVTGTPGQFFALIGSSVNSGFSYAGVALGVGPDVAIISLGALDGSGTATLSFRPPFDGTTLDRYYVQVVTSASANFVPPQAGQRAVVRNADLVSASLPTARTGTPTLAIPAGSFVLHGIVQVVNGTPAEFATSCHFIGGFTGVVYPASVFVPTGRNDTIPLLATVTAAAPTTVSVTCATMPPPGVGFAPAIVAIPVGSIIGPTTP